VTVSAGTEQCLGPLAQVPVGEGRTFRVADVTVAVFHLRNGEVHATQAACPHRRGPLADGILGGSTVICPLPTRKFDVASGAALTDGCGLVTYPARVSATDEIIIDVHAGAEAGQGADPVPT